MRISALEPPRAALDSDLIETEPPRSTPVDAEETPAPASFGVSCESAISAYHEELEIGKRQRAPDLPREAFAAVLEDGRYWARCSVPGEMTVEICAAVQEGRAVGVTVVTRPSNQRVRACVTNAVRRLSFPKSSRLDVTHTRFAPAP